MPQVSNSEKNSAVTDKILATAKELFLSKGFRATTIREIAQTADISLGLVLYYFKSKENLAGQIAYDILQQFYAQIDYGRMSSISTGAKLYVNNLLFYEFQFSDTYYGPLFFELNITTDIIDSPSPSARRLTEQIIREHGLHVTSEENDIYLTALMGANKNLIKRYWYKELKLTPMQLTDLLISNYFYNIGLEDSEIARIITEGQRCYNLLKKEKPDLMQFKA